MDPHPSFLIAKVLTIAMAAPPPPSYDYAVRSQGVVKPEPPPQPESAHDIELGQIPPNAAPAPISRSPPAPAQPSENKVIITLFIALGLLTVAWCAGLPFGSKATNLLKRDCACSAKWPMRRQWDYETHPTCINSPDSPNAKSCCVKERSGENPKGICKADDYARFQRDGGVGTAEKFYVAGILIVIFVILGILVFAAWFSYWREDLRSGDEDVGRWVLAVLSAIVGGLIVCVVLAAVFNLAGFEVKWGHFALAIYWILQSSTGVALFILWVGICNYPEN